MLNGSFIINEISADYLTGVRKDNVTWNQSQRDFFFFKYKFSFIDSEEFYLSFAFWGSLTGNVGCSY